MINTARAYAGRRSSPLDMLGLSLLLCVVLCASAAAAPRRIHVRHGTVYAHGYLHGFQSRADFVLHARRHQHLGLLITRGGATVVMLYGSHGFVDGAPGGIDSVLPRTGDYRIKITEHRMAEPWRGPFTLRVRLH